MAGDRKLPRSVPPETGGIDIEWSGFLDEEPTMPGIIPEAGVRDSDRPTQVPDEPPEQIARRLMSSLDEDDERRALSNPGFRAVSEDDLPGREEMKTLTEGDPLAHDRRFDQEAVTARGEEVGTLSLDLPEDAGGALDLVGSFCSMPRPRPSEAEEVAAPPPDVAVEMRERYAVGDFTGALVMAEAALEADSGDQEARRYVSTCRDILQQMYTARLGSTDLVPRVTLSSDQIRWLTLDHKAGFLLSCIDGYSSIDEILDVCGMPSLDALRILCDLLQQNVITVSSAR